MTHPPFSVPPVKISLNVHCASQQSTNTKFTTDEIQYCQDRNINILIRVDMWRID